MQYDTEHDGEEMTAWANPAAERAALTCDADHEDLPANGWERIDELAPDAREPSPGRLARIRQRVDALLADMLADECDHAHAHLTDQELSEGEPADTELLRPDVADAGLIVAEASDAEFAGAGFDVGSVGAEIADGPTLARTGIAKAGPPSQANPRAVASQQAAPGRSDRSGSSADNSTAQDSSPSPSRSDEGFWGQDEADAAPTPGYKSKHRLTGPAKDFAPSDGRRGRPRHAAPPASFAVFVGRRLAVIKLAAHCAGHAA